MQMSLLRCTVALCLCTCQLLAQETAYKPVSSGLQAYHPIKKWRGLDLQAYLRGTGYFGGSYNTASGTNALVNANSSSLQNTADGYSALQYCYSCKYNIGVGYDALAAMNTGTANTAVGVNAAYGNNGNNNTAMGYAVLNDNYSGSNNTALGYATLAGSLTESNSVAVGYNTMGYSNAAYGYNTAIGTYALYGSNSTGSYNAVCGAYGMYSNTTGSSNTVAGYNAMYENSTGSENAAAGAYALAGRLDERLVEPDGGGRNRLEVKVGVVAASRKRLAQAALQQSFGNAEFVKKISLMFHACLLLLFPCLMLLLT